MLSIICTIKSVQVLPDKEGGSSAADQHFDEARASSVAPDPPQQLASPVPKDSAGVTVSKSPMSSLPKASADARSMAPIADLPNESPHVTPKSPCKLPTVAPPGLHVVALPTDPALDSLSEPQQAERV